MIGAVRYGTEGGRGKMDFSYETIRLWKVPAKRLLNAGIGAATLAVPGELPSRQDLHSGITDVLRELDRRFRSELEPAEANELQTTVGVLLGLRVSKAVEKSLTERVLTMEESTTYQLIIEKGELLGQLKEARDVVLSLGRKQFGPPSKKVQSVLARVSDLKRPHHMRDCVFEASSWQDVIDTP